jgi:hypothetical protein
MGGHYCPPPPNIPIEWQITLACFIYHGNWRAPFLIQFIKVTPVKHLIYFRKRAKDVFNLSRFSFYKIYVRESRQVWHWKVNFADQSMLLRILFKNHLNNTRHQARKVVMFCHPGSCHGLWLSHNLNIPSLLHVFNWRVCVDILVEWNLRCLSNSHDWDRASSSAGKL